MATKIQSLEKNARLSKCGNWVQMSIKIYKLRRKNQITSLRQDEIVNIHVSCNS
jgi:hypothetical protein